MLFNSYTFIIYFIVVLLIYRLISGWTLRKLFLLIASYLFYAAWNPPFVVLLWISTIADWFIAKKMHKTSSLGKRKLQLILSLMVNLGMLGYFKYGLFILSNFVYLLSLFGINYTPPTPNIILPVGISFYTFQTLSYTFDVFRKKMTPWHSFLDYALYVTFFPQLVAGPIVRAVDFLPQCDSTKQGNQKQMGWGLSLLVVGLFNKVVIADSFMAPVVERIYDSADIPGFFQAWAGTLAFSVQIFCDFSGYSTCAIGIAMCFGFVLPDNFRFPYAATGFSDFWRRWHITLSSWLRDYLYISLGGNRKGALRTYINLMLTMLIGGLWHGASWLFVIWGGLHGLYLIIERLVKKMKFSKNTVWELKLVQVLLSLLTFALVSFAWVFFRSSNLNHAYNIAKAMVGMIGFSTKSTILLSRMDFLIVLFSTSSMLALHWIMRNKSLEEITAKFPMWIRTPLMALMMYLIVISFSGEERAFIYFQF